MRVTYTCVVLELSLETYAEIRNKLRDAGYHHAFMEDGSIDMRGIAVRGESDGKEKEETGKGILT